MKFKADETHYKSKRLHQYLYFRSRAVQRFSSREPPTCTPPRARAHALPEQPWEWGRHLQVRLPARMPFISEGCLKAARKKHCQN